MIFEISLICVTNEWPKGKAWFCKVYSPPILITVLHLHIIFSTLFENTKKLYNWLLHVRLEIIIILQHAEICYNDDKLKISLNGNMYLHIEFLYIMYFGAMKCNSNDLNRFKMFLNWLRNLNLKQIKFIVLKL